jgi:hypothetical protein
VSLAAPAAAVAASESNANIDCRRGVVAVCGSRPVAIRGRCDDATTEACGQCDKRENSEHDLSSCYSLEEIAAGLFSAGVTAHYLVRGDHFAARAMWIEDASLLELEPRLQLLTLVVVGSMLQCAGGCVVERTRSNRNLLVLLFARYRATLAPLL